MGVGGEHTRFPLVSPRKWMVKKGKGINHRTKRSRRVNERPSFFKFKTEEMGAFRLPPSGWDSPRLERGALLLGHRDPPIPGERHRGTDIGGGPLVKQLGLQRPLVNKTKPQGKSLRGL